MPLPPSLIHLIPSIQQGALPQGVASSLTGNTGSRGRMLGQGCPETHLFGALRETPVNPDTEFFKRWSEKDSHGDFRMAATVPYFPL